MDGDSDGFMVITCNGGILGIAVTCKIVGITLDTLTGAFDGLSVGKFEGTFFNPILGTAVVGKI